MNDYPATRAECREIAKRTDVLRDRLRAAGDGYALAIERGLSDDVARYRREMDHPACALVERRAWFDRIRDRLRACERCAITALDDVARKRARALEVA